MTGLPQSVLVLGASGYVGTHLVPRLVERGYRVRAASRRREALEARGWDGVEIAEADALDEASLERALEGVEIAYYLVHSMAAGRDFAALDREAADRFVRAAERAGGAPHHLPRRATAGAGGLATPALAP